MTYDAQARRFRQVTRLSGDDVYLFNEGSHFRTYEHLGAHLMEVDGVPGTYFAVWAPDALRVSVIGDFNEWRPEAQALLPHGSSGIWEAFVPGVRHGASYKFHVVSRHRGYVVDKSDPHGVFQEVAPRTASRVWDLSYQWGDQEWLAARARRQALDQPLSVYEVHLGSWRRVPDEENRSLTYLELAPLLIEHVKSMGFTHVQFLPLLEHPFYGTWGYGATGYFAVTSRYGTPQDFMRLVDLLHQAGIGVSLDWVPAHFPSDEASLGFFDGTHLFEHADPRRGYHPDWNSLIFNFGRHEIRSFLISSASFWLDKYHLDGLRVDAVASMLYLDYSRKAGEWLPNRYGGKENLEAIEFLKRLNEHVYGAFPGVQTIAEESTAWPMVSRPVYLGGLGFGLKWDMGWMHDTLAYMASDPVHRKFKQNEITFRQLYSEAENFMLPLSHDEVVHGKGSLLGRMPGDTWQKFANLRLLYAWMFAQNGKKLLFMGSEFGQWNEWYHEASLDWNLLEHAPHQGVSRFVRRLNEVYRNEPSLHARDAGGGGFEWIDCHDADNSVLCLLRRGAAEEDVTVVVLNFTPVPRDGYRIGVPHGGTWRVLVNGDDEEYGGSGCQQARAFPSEPHAWHGRPHSLRLSLPPLAALFLKRDAGAGGGPGP